MRAGTPLHVLNEELAAFGYALPNLGDIDRQSLAGATGTGTHGTGLRLTGLSAGIRALRIVLADGSVVECSPTREPELFQAARLGLGALGIVTEITVGGRARLPAPRRRAPEPLDERARPARTSPPRPTTTSSSTGSRTPTAP